MGQRASFLAVAVYDSKAKRDANKMASNRILIPSPCVDMLNVENYPLMIHGQTKNVAQKCG